VVVHVVCWGYDEAWEGEAQHILRAELARGNSGDIDLGTVLEYNRTRELDEFRQTCSILLDSWRSDIGQEYNLIIAVTKADLYWRRREEARDYYLPVGAAPAHESPFCSDLRDLVAMIGQDKLRLAVVPVSCRMENYVFDGLDAGRNEYHLGGKQINALTKNFRGLLGNFCADQRIQN
jgi:hypothetical protein